MHLTKAELKRLMELSAKTAATLTADETKELAALQAKVNAIDENADQGAINETQLKALIAEAVKTAGNGATADQVKSLIAEAVKTIPAADKVDVKALTDTIDAQIKAAIKPGLTAEDVKSIVAEGVKGLRRESKMQHDEGSTDITLPIAHRLGNCTVASKQLLNVMLGKHVDDGITETQLKDAQTKGAVIERNLEHAMRYGTKTITTTGAGTGLEFMNSTISTVLLQRMYLASQFAQMMVANEIQMPSDPYKYPLGTTRPTFYVGSENPGSDPTASEGGTDDLIFTSKKLIGRTNYSYEADEDSLFALLPKIMADLGDAAADALEGAMINGDTTSTHQDSDIHAVALHHAKLFDGIRKLTLAQATLKQSWSSGGVSAANTGALRKLLGRWGMKPADLLIVAGVLAYNDYILLPETLTAEKTGNPGTARILTGVAPSIFGIPIVPSSQVREDLNASGVYDGSTTTKGSLIMLHKPSWFSGVRRGFTVEQDKDISKQTKFVVASFRRDFKPLEALTATKAAALAYNWTA